MARVAAPLPMQFKDWVTLGCPPLLLSVAHVSTWCGVSVMMVNNYVKDGRLFRHPDGPNKSKIPTDHPSNKEWLLDRGGAEKRELNSPGRPPRTPKVPAAAPRQSTQTLKEHFDSFPLPPSRPASAGEDMLDLGEVLEALHTLDFSKLSAQAVQKVARIETALKTRADREAKRGLLIERSLVSVVFARLYQVDTNELRTIGAKVAPDVAAELGVEDPETILKIEKRIDDEILKSLNHIKRLMDDFLVGVGGEPVPTE